MTKQTQSELANNIIAKARALAMRNRHAYTTLEHLLVVLLQEESVRGVLAQCKVDLAAIDEDVIHALREVPRVAETDDPANAQDTPALWRVIRHTLQQHVDSGRERLEAYHMLVPFFDEQPGSVALAILLRQNLKRAELVRVISHGSRGKANAAGGKAESDDALAAYTLDLNEKAESGELDPLVGRDREIERLVQVLGRRRKNNPLLVGDPGVGKTAIAEGLAQRIVSGAVPERLRSFKLHTLNMGAMIAGTKYRGDFEERCWPSWKVGRRWCCSSTRPTPWWARAVARAQWMPRTSSSLPWPRARCG